MIGLLLALTVAVPQTDCVAETIDEAVACIGRTISPGSRHRMQSRSINVIDQWRVSDDRLVIGEGLRAHLSGVVHPEDTRQVLVLTYWLRDAGCESEAHKLYAPCEQAAGLREDEITVCGTPRLNCPSAEGMIQ